MKKFLKIISEENARREVSVIVLSALICLTAIWLVQAQSSQLGPGKDFKYPDYYPSTDGSARLRSVVTGEEYRFLANNSAVALIRPRIEAFREDGTTLEWSAIAHGATVDINTREVHGNTNMFFRTADDRLFLTGVGFLWQQASGVLILSNKTFTWIETRRLTNSSSKHSTNKMKTLVAVSLVATARLTAAEMEIPPARPGLSINAETSVLMLKSNIVIFSNNVVVVDPPSKPGEPPMILKCVWLVGRRDASGKIEEIEAHEQVQIDHGDTHARGNYARYSATNELIALVGMFDPKDGNNAYPYVYTYLNTNSPTAITNRGEAIIYDRVKNELSTYGKVQLSVPGEALKSGSPFEVGSPTNRAPKKPSPPN